MGIQGQEAYRHKLDVAHTSIMTKVFIVLVWIGFIAFPCIVHSQDTVYTYTGGPFTAFYGLPGVDMTDSVTGSPTLSSPLAPNLPLTDITALITAATFSVTGTHPKTIPPPAAVCTATVSTDSTANIVQ